jgi:hypothetical protein
MIKEESMSSEEKINWSWFREVFIYIVFVAVTWALTWWISGSKALAFVFTFIIPYFLERSFLIFEREAKRTDYEVSEFEWNNVKDDMTSTFLKLVFWSLAGMVFCDFFFPFLLAPIHSLPVNYRLTLGLFFLLLVKMVELYNQPQKQR